ncbi:MAG: ABC transporter permease [Phycisphaerales bacterium]
MDRADTPSTSAWTRLLRSRSALVGLVILAVVVAACLGSLPFTLGESPSGTARHKAGSLDAFLLPPAWAPHGPDETQRLEAVKGAASAIDPAPPYVLGTDKLGRSLLVRVLAGGGVSIGIGIAAALVSVCIGVLWGAVAGWVGGRTDAVMMRIVDVLYGLPYILLVVLFAVAGEAMVERLRGSAGGGGGSSTMGEAAERSRSLIELGVLLLAIGGVSWLTMSRVIRGQVLSLKARPFIEAARAAGVGPVGVFTRHLLPNLLGPIIVYATLTVPQAILQESFLSFLGIGVKPPLPSWGNLVSEGLSELNPVRVRWWLLAFPCVMLAVSLVSLNLVGEAMREAFDPRSRRR